jgi:large subunit ribosomal protein L29
MALPKIAEVLEMTAEQVSEAILESKKKLFDLRFKQATRQEVKSHEYTHVKHRMSQLLMVEGQRASQGADSAS